MRLGAWIALLSLVVQAGVAPIARAHDAGGGKESKRVLADPSIQALHEHLEKILSRSVRQGVVTQTDDEERAGELLVNAAYSEVVDELQALPPTAGQDALRILRAVVHGINPVAIGKWLLETARRKGPALAIIYGVTEIAEDIGVMLSAKYPALLFLVPLSVTHASDVIVIALALGVPHVVRLARLWQRFGGLIDGPKAYYEQLLAQRQVLPIDWSEVVDVDSIKTALSSGAVEEVQFAIVSEGIFERNLPRGLRLAFSPRKLAQRESVPTFSIHELEQIAKQGGVSIKSLRVFKGEPQIYATLLLREISLSRDAAVAFSTEVRIRHESTAVGGVARPDNAWGKAKIVDAATLLDLRTPEELEKLGTDVGETPDLIAQRAVWYLRDLADQLYERTKSVTKEEKQTLGVSLREARKALRRLNKLVDTNASLARITNSPASKEGSREWHTLFDELMRASGLVEKVRASLPPDPETMTSHCESLLLSA